MGWDILKLTTRPRYIFKESIGKIYFTAKCTPLPPGYEMVGPKMGTFKCSAILRSGNDVCLNYSICRRREHLWYNCECFFSYHEWSWSSHDQTPIRQWYSCQLLYMIWMQTFLSKLYFLDSWTYVGTCNTIKITKSTRVWLSLSVSVREWDSYAHTPGLTHLSLVHNPLWCMCTLSIL